MCAGHPSLPFIPPALLGLLPAWVMSRLLPDCDSSDFADGEPGGLGRPWGSPIGMHLGTARPPLLSTAMVHGRHSEGAPELGRQKTAPVAEGVRVALRPLGWWAGPQSPPVSAVGWGGSGGETQVAPNSVTAGRGLRGNSPGASQPTRCPRGLGCHVAAPRGLQSQAWVRPLPVPGLWATGVGVLRGV